MRKKGEEVPVVQIRVHGNTFVPQHYGEDHLHWIEDHRYSDIQGLKEGPRARFHMRDDRRNWFHSTIPTLAGDQLIEASVLLRSLHPQIEGVFVFDGRRLLRRSPPRGQHVNIEGTLYSRTAVDLLERPRVGEDGGVSVSVQFTTIPENTGAGEVEFLSAGLRVDRA
jgi:hypothetical protein